MIKKTPKPLPGVRLVPRLLAYQIARQCEREDVLGIIAVVMNADDTWSVQVSDGVRACEETFAAAMLVEDAIRFAKSWTLDSAEEDEDEE